MDVILRRERLCSCCVDAGCFLLSCRCSLLQPRQILLGVAQLPLLAQSLLLVSLPLQLVLQATLTLWFASFVSLLWQKRLTFPYEGISLGDGQTPSNLRTLENLMKSVSFESETGWKYLRP